MNFDNDTMTTSHNIPALVSVIVPVLNDQPGVNGCLRAIAAQTYPNDCIEVVVIDNGSTVPLTLSEIYPFKCTVVRCMTPGSYAARNSGVDCSSGQVLAFIDADCWPDPNWLASGIHSLMGCGDKKIVGGEVRIMKPTSYTAASLYQYVTGFGQEANVRERGFSATANLFCTRRQFDIVGRFDERLLSGGDLEWSARAKKLGFFIQYEPDAVVYTEARSSLRGAVRQARRVAAGRVALKELHLEHVSEAAIDRRLSAWRAARWIFLNPELSTLNRLRVGYAALVIRLAAAVERWRLAFGGSAERR